MIKVTHLSFSAIGGGAAIACRRLNEAMQRFGIDSRIVTANQLSPVPTHASRLWRIWFKFYSRRYWKSFRSASEQHKTLGTWSAGYSLNRLDTNVTIRDGDIVYLHWINSNMVSIEELGRLLDSGKQVIWFLHDMWPFTGGCHYSLDCLSFHSHCGACPMLSSSNEMDLSFSVFERKLKHLFGRNNLTIVSPSRWLADCARRSRLFAKNHIEVIPNIIDPDVFRPIRKRVAREALGLPLDKQLILFGCDAGSKNFYKGWNFLREAFSIIDSGNLELVMFGSNEQDSLKHEFSQKVHFLGRLNDELSLRLAYSAANVFVSPSIAENFSQTLCESSACGTPTVCFDIGGNSDIVQHKQTGYCAMYKDSEDLAQGINWILDSAHYDDLAQKAREHIVSLCAPEVVINQHKRLLRMLALNER